MKKRILIAIIVIIGLNAFGQGNTVKKAVNYDAHCTVLTIISDKLILAKYRDKTYAIELPTIEGLFDGEDIAFVASLSHFSEKFPSVFYTRLVPYGVYTYKNVMGGRVTVKKFFVLKKLRSNNS